MAWDDQDVRTPKNDWHNDRAAPVPRSARMFAVMTLAKFAWAVARIRGPSHWRAIGLPRRARGVEFGHHRRPSRKLFNPGESDESASARGRGRGRCGSRAG